MHDWIPCVLLNDRARFVLFDKIGYGRSLIAMLFEVLLLAFFFRTFTRRFTLIHVDRLSRALICVDMGNDRRIVRNANRELPWRT